ncbi:MAG: hypothetical protein SOH58_02845 [Olsenella sp.]
MPPGETAGSHVLADHRRAAIARATVDRRRTALVLKAASASLRPRGSQG